MIDNTELPFRVDKMTSQDVPAVMDIELVSFSAPWSARAYEYELHHNEMAHYYVVRPPEEFQPVVAPERVTFWQRILGRQGTKPPTVHPSNVLGYGGFWMMVDEAHISTVATHPHWRGRGVGELLMLALIEEATAIGARWVTLEVRVSNVTAQSLYRKYGFEVTGRRMKYYNDNGEDALIMTTPLVTTIEYQLKIEGLKGMLASRLSRQE